jgi:hypothetical protein
MTHSLPPHFGLDDFHAALLTDDAAVFHPLVLATVAFIVLDRTENLGTKQSIPFRLEGSVVDGLRFLHFAVRPFSNLLGRREGNLHRVVAGWILRLCKKIVQFFQG